MNPLICTGVPRATLEAVLPLEFKWPLKGHSVPKARQMTGPPRGRNGPPRGRNDPPHRARTGDMRFGRGIAAATCGARAVPGPSYNTTVVPRP